MPTMTSSPTSLQCSVRALCNISLTACERLSKPRSFTMRSRSRSRFSGSEIEMRLTGRLRPCADTLMRGSHRLTSSAFSLHVVGHFGQPRHDGIGIGVFVLAGVRRVLMDELLEPRLGGDELGRDQ